jgi:hypothetical protein
MHLPLPASGLKRLAAVMLYFMAGLTVVAIGVSYFGRHAILEHMFANHNVQIVNLPGGGYMLEVPAKSIPATISQLSGAPPIQLLPAHWAVLDRSNVPGAADQALLTPARRARLTKTTLAFLKSWETFPELPTRRSYSHWRSALAPYVGPGAGNEIYGRVEAFAPDGICPKSPCITGSSWYTGYPSSDPLTVRRVEGSTVYVTVYGLIQYHDPRAGGINGQLQLREYGLILQEQDGRWLVSRVVADSVAQ